MGAASGMARALYGENGRQYQRFDSASGRSRRRKALISRSGAAESASTVAFLRRSIAIRDSRGAAHTWRQSWLAAGLSGSPDQELSEPYRGDRSEVNAAMIGIPGRHRGAGGVHLVRRQRGYVRASLLLTAVLGGVTGWGAGILLTPYKSEEGGPSDLQKILLAGLIGYLIAKFNTLADLISGLGTGGGVAPVLPHAAVALILFISAMAPHLCAPHLQDVAAGARSGDPCPDGQKPEAGKAGNSRRGGRSPFHACRSKGLTCQGQRSGERPSGRAKS